MTAPPDHGGFGSSATLEAALTLAAFGLRVFPLRPRDKRPPHGPDWTRWYDYATSDPDEVRRLWLRAGYDSNVAILTGQTVATALGPMRLLAFDVDEREGSSGADTLAAIEAELGRLPDTVRAITGRRNGSAHLLFLVPLDTPEVTSPHLGPGLQVKGHHGYIVAAGSTHPDTGELYEWEADLGPGEVAVAVMPARFVAYMVERQRRHEVVERSHAAKAAGRLEKPGDHLPDWPELLTSTELFGAYVCQPAGTKWLDGAARQLWTRPDGRNPHSNPASAIELDAGLWVYSTEWPTCAGTVLEASDVTRHTYSPMGYYAAMTEGASTPEAMRRAAGRLAERFGLERPELVSPALASKVIQGPWGPSPLQARAQHPSAQSDAGATEPPASAAATDDELTGSSWRRVNWRTVDDTPDVPSIGRLGHLALFYPGKVHSLVGGGESGKTWLALHIIVELARAGYPSAIVDHENGAKAMVGRLMRSFGLTPEQMDLVRIIEPEEPLLELRNGRVVANEQALADFYAEVSGCHLVVLDGMTESLGMHGLSANAGTEVATWLRYLCRPLAKAGIAVVIIDHPGVNADARNRAAGSGHKRNGIDVVLLVHNVERFARGKGDGMSTVNVDKDRPGALREVAQGEQRSELARFHLSSQPSGEHDEVRTSLELVTPKAAPVEGPDDMGSGVTPKLAERASRLIEEKGPCFLKDVAPSISKSNNVGGNTVRWLKLNAYVDDPMDPHDRRRKLVSLRPYRAPVVRPLGLGLGGLLGDGTDPDTPGGCSHGG